MMKKISVVVPCYNVAEYLDRCMEHIVNQTIGLENIEIVLVDDASTDGGATLSLMMEYEKKYPDNIIVIPLEQNLRQGGARNVGIMYASGEYLMFCDADDWLMLDAMEILYHIALKYDADVVEFQHKDVTKAELETVKEAGTDILERYMSQMDMPGGTKDKMECDIWDFGEDDEKRKKFMISCTDECTLGCWNKLYRMQMIKDNHIRFAEYLICEEPSFTLPVRAYERRHIVINAELHCCFQSSNSTVRSRWDDRKLDNFNVWLIIVQDFEEKGLREKYYNELEYMFFSWGIELSIRMLVARGYMLSMEEWNLFKSTLLRLFPDVLQNPYVIEYGDERDSILKTFLEIK